MRRAVAALLQPGRRGTVEHIALGTIQQFERVGFDRERSALTRQLGDLFDSPARIRAATRGWSDADRALLHRPAGAPCTPADVPLLEEADGRREISLRDRADKLEVSRTFSHLFKGS